MEQFLFTERFRERDTHLCVDRDLNDAERRLILSVLDKMGVAEMSFRATDVSSVSDPRWVGLD